MNKRIINEYNNYKKLINTNNESINKYVSPILIKSNDILEIYNIMNMDDLEKWVKNNLDDINFFTINRIINCWIRVNLNILKKHPKYVIYIIYIIFKYYFKDIDLKKYSKNIDSYIIKWLKKKKIKDYYLNLYYDLKEYMINNSIIYD